MRTYVVDLTAGGKLSELMATQFGMSVQGERCAQMGLQNLSTSGVTINFGAVGNPAHEMLPGQTVLWPIGSTKNIEFGAAAVDVIVSLLSE